MAAEENSAVIFYARVRFRSAKNTKREVIRLKNCPVRPSLARRANRQCFLVAWRHFANDYDAAHVKLPQHFRACAAYFSSEAKTTMSSDNSKTAENIFTTAQVASLGTTAEDGSPFVSLVTVAANQQRATMLLSGLAVHTKNLERDPRCSLLLVEPGGESGNPLEGARLTLSGSVSKLAREQDGDSRQVFLTQHPSAAMYADFGDFAFYDFEIDSAYLVAGFGKIQKMTAAELFGTR